MDTVTKVLSVIPHVRNVVYEPQSVFPEQWKFQIRIPGVSRVPAVLSAPYIGQFGLTVTLPKRIRDSIRATDEIMSISEFSHGRFVCVVSGSFVYWTACFDVLSMPHGSARQKIHTGCMCLIQMATEDIQLALPILDRIDANTLNLNMYLGTVEQRLAM